MTVCKYIVPSVCLLSKYDKRKALVSDLTAGVG